MIVTFGVDSSPLNPTRLTPALRVKFSVYVPGRMKMSVPDTEAVKAAAIVVKSPFPEGSTVKPLATL